jgi:hypothetical protein
MGEGELKRLAVHQVEKGEKLSHRGVSCGDYERRYQLRRQ